MLQDRCKVGAPHTLIKLRANDDHTHYRDFLVNQLVLENVEVTNFYYPMNSLFNVSNFGGEITISNSKFERINICGSIIKNIVVSSKKQDFSQISPSYLTPEMVRYAETVGEMAKVMDTLWRQQYYNTHDDDY